MVAPYVKMATAEQLRFPNTDVRVSAPDQLLLWQRLQLQAAGDLVHPWPCPDEVSAFITRGWWGVQCPHCQQGCVTHPAWKLAACIECGAILTRVVVPADYRAIEETLLRRPLRETHLWLAHETVDDLRRENAEHGIPEAA